MASLADLMIRLGVDSSGVGEGMDKANKSMKVGALALAGGIGVAGKALFDLGSTFDSMSDTIANGTGATGAHLDSLVASAKNIGKEVPASFGDIGTALTAVNQRLGLSGPALEKVTSQFLELGNITDTKIDIPSVTGALSSFGVKSADVSNTLDAFFRISQQTGVSVDSLASTIGKSGATMKSFGFDASQSAALVGTMDKAGISSTKVVSSLSHAMVAFAKEGKSPKQGLDDTVASIKKMTAAGNTAGATSLAAKIFGAKTAPQFIAAINSGKLSIDSLNKVVAGSGGTIIGAAKGTADFAESWQIFKNKAMLALEPIATRVFTLITQGMNWIADNGIPIMQSIVATVERFKTPLEVVGAILTAVLIPRIVMWGVESLKAAAKAVTGWVVNQTAATLSAAASVIAFGAMIAGWIKTGVQATLSALKIAAAWLISLGPIALVIAAVAGVTYLIVKNFDKIKNAIAAAFNWVKAHWPLILTILTGPFGLAVAAIIKHWDKIASTAKAVPGRIKAAFTGAADWLKNAGIDVIKGLISGMTDKLGDLKGFLGGVGSKIVSWKGPPSYDKVMLKGNGQLIIQSLIDGMKSKTTDLKAQVDAITASIKDKLAAARDLKKSIQDTFALDFSANSDPTGPSFIDGLKIQVAKAKAFAATLSALAAAGLNKNIVAGFAAQGPSSLDQVSQINGSNVGQVNKLYKQMNATGSTFANQQVMAQTGIDLTKAQPVKVIFDVRGGDKALRDLIKQWVRTDGGGDVQVAFGKK